MHFMKLYSTQGIILFISCIFCFKTIIKGDDYIYFKNFVKHADGTTCEASPPQASFTVYMNSDSARILTDLSPRWDAQADPNIDGKGTFGVELGNFHHPSFQTGDTVHIRFTCNEQRQQGALTDICQGIPWYRFPATLSLQNINLPDRPQQLSLSKNEENGQRQLSWMGDTANHFKIYRRTYSDTLENGLDPMQYQLTGETDNSLSFVDTSALNEKKYGYLIYAVDSAGNISGRSAEVNEDPYVSPGLDLTIGYIARLPRIDYVWDSNNPEIEGWPPPDEPVTWRAVVKNWGDTVLHDVSYDWYVDGQIVESGELTMPARDTVTIDYPWVWTFERHKIKLVMDAANEIAEEEEENNTLSIFTDAISVGFYVEKSVYDYFRRYQKKLGVHANCWEDWAQRHVRIWNSMFANAVFELTPNGVLDRIRIDKITVVPDGDLPLNGGLPTNNPNLDDRTVDLQWGFPKTLLDGNFYADHSHATLNNPFYFEGSLLHELGHARYLIDVYGFNVHDHGSGQTVAIKEDGQLIVGTDFMPLYGDRVFFAPYTGLMGGDYTKVDAYSAAALNLIAGHRAIKGNYNAPGNIGVYLQDLPQKNYLQLTDQKDNPLKEARIDIYQAQKQDGVWYGKYYDDQADMVLQADSSGVVSLGHCPFDDDGTVDHTYGLANGVLIVRAEHESRIGYGFLDVTKFNMAYWEGNQQEAYHELTIEMQAPQAIDEQPHPSPITNFELHPNFPDPFNSSTKIRMHLPQTGYLSLAIYNCTGKQIKTLFAGHLSAGFQEWQWHGKNEADQRAGSGIYFVRAVFNDRHFVERMLLLK
ncbi:MAG: hypothetical protein GF313_16015 [Caldithrix sp.]|nr:hypothetical protein [Caldithrix sp.]